MTTRLKMLAEVTVPMTRVLMLIPAPLGTPSLVMVVLAGVKTWVEISRVT